MEIFSKNKSYLLAIALLVISACGGGGGDDEPQNIAPTVSVANLTIAEEATVSIAANASDSDGTIVSYSWVRKSGEEIVLSGTETNTVTFTAPLLTGDSEVVLTVTVTDNEGATASDDVTVTITHTNIAPSVSVENSSVAEEKEASITALAEDSDGTIESYLWTRVSGEEVVLSGTNSETVTFTAPSLTQDSEVVLSVTVTDDDGATSSSEVTVTITANITHLVVSGLVTDGPFASANILFKVGEDEFSTVANDVGEYTIQISADDSLVQQMVKATATGADSNSHVVLTSVFGSFASMLEMAGDDGELTIDEMLAVNITNISTAITGLMEISNEGLIADQDSFELAAKSYNGVFVLPMATSIKLAIQYSTEKPALILPEGVENTADFVTDLEVIKGYIHSAKATNESEYDQAEREILDNRTQILSGVNHSEMPMADTYYFLFPEGISNGGRLTLNENATGIYIDLNGEQSFNWIASDSEVAITYPSGQFVESISYTGANDDVIVETISIGKTLRWLSQTEKSAQLMITNTTYRHYPGGEFSDEDEVITETIVNSVKSAGVLDAANILEMNVSYAMPTPRVLEDIINPTSESLVFGQLEYRRQSAAMIFSGSESEGGTVTVSTFDISGDGSKTNRNQVMDWSINNSGHLVITGNDTFEYAFLLVEDGQTPVVNVLVDEGSAPRTMSDNMVRKEASEWTNESVVGIYNNIWDSFEFESYFWVEVNADGTTLTVSATDTDNNGVIEGNEYYLAPGLWRINELGNLVVRRYMLNLSIDSSYTYCTPTQFDPADDENCLLWHEREWDIHQVTPNGEYYMNHQHRFFEDIARDFRQDQSVSGHILSLATTDIRYWKKLEERPVELPTQKSIQTKNLKSSPFVNLVEDLHLMK